MSKTDKTRPNGVKVLDDPNWLTGHHDHRFGPCDLGPKPTDRADVSWRGPGGEQRCFWWFSHQFNYAPDNRYPAPGDHEWRRAERRKERHSGRAIERDEYLNASRAAAGAGLADVDGLSALDPFWYDPWVEEYHNGFEAEVRDNARVAEALDAPAGTLVVDVSYRGGKFDLDEDPEPSPDFSALDTWLGDPAAPAPAEAAAVDLDAWLTELEVLATAEEIATEYVEVTLMHNDGRREVLTFREPWSTFHARTTGGEHS